MTAFFIFHPLHSFRLSVFYAKIQEILAFFISKIWKITIIALGGGLGRPRRLGTPLQKERGSGLDSESIFVFLLPSLLIVLKSLRVIRCLVSYQGHNYP